MSFFNPTPEERAEAERRSFAATPAGQARSARIDGRKIFQIDIPLSRTTASTEALVGARAKSTKTEDSSMVIQSIEEEGWRLEHVGYVYRLTGSESRDKLFASGQQEAVSGEIIGIYIFRVRENT